MAKIKISGFRCERCSHEWVPIDRATEPRVCPHCKSPYWNLPRRANSKDADDNQAQIANLLVKRKRLEDAHADRISRLAKMTVRQACAWARHYEQNATTKEEVVGASEESHALRLRIIDDQIGRLRGEITTPLLGVEALPEIMERLGIGDLVARLPSSRAARCLQPSEDDGI